MEAADVRKWIERFDSLDESGGSLFFVEGLEPDIPSQDPEWDWVRRFFGSRLVATSCDISTRIIATGVEGRWLHRGSGVEQAVKLVHQPAPRFLRSRLFWFHINWTEARVARIGVQGSGNLSGHDGRSQEAGTPLGGKINTRIDSRRAATSESGA